MTLVDGLNSHRWIILIVVHVAFILPRNANAQSLSSRLDELEPPGLASTKTTVYALFVTVLFLIGLLSFHIYRCTRPNPEYPGGYFRRRDDDCSRRGGLENAVVESFPVFACSSVKETKIGFNELECAICLSKFEDCETVRLLPICNHLFHIDCIDAWLHSHTTCPVCRSDLTVKSVKIDDSLVRDQVVIDIDDVMVRPSSVISGKFSRSNSTGHSVNQLSDGDERLTLRLPDVKKKIMAANGRSLERTRTFDCELTAKYGWSAGESSYRVGPDQINWVDRWNLFISKSNSSSLTRSNSNSGSVSSQRSNGELLK